MSENIAKNLSGLKKEDFQAEIQGKKTDLFILRNNKGYEVAITNYGGAMVAIMVPDRNGKVANVIMGHDNINDVVNKPEPFLSTLIGRYGNRICKGRFTLDGKEYTLALNNGANSLHGGPTGFHARVWDAKQIDAQTVELHYVAADMEEGFPGKLDVTVVYQFNDENALVIDYKAKTDKKTVVNLTNHGYFALAGIANPTPVIDDLICEINADHYIPIDETAIPLGPIASVEGTPFDFRKPKAVGKDIDADDIQIKNGAGYDHCYVLNKKEVGELSFAAVAAENGLEVEKVVGKFSRNLWNQQHLSNDTFATIINVNYNDDNDDHWVGVKGMTRQNNKDYFIITASSDNDSFMGKTKHSNRGNKGWKIQSNNILVPVEQIKGYVNFIKRNEVEE